MFFLYKLLLFFFTSGNKIFEGVEKKKKKQTYFKFILRPFLHKPLGKNENPHMRIEK